MTVAASGTSLTQIFGVGPIVAATVIGGVRDVSRFPDRDHFVAGNGTSPIEVSSGPRKVCRRAGAGNRRLNHAIHMAAVTQIRYRHSAGRACYDRKRAEGKTPKEALRSLRMSTPVEVIEAISSASRREVEREDVLAPHDPAGVGEAVAEVEPARRAGAVRAAGVEHVGAWPRLR